EVAGVVIGHPPLEGRRDRRHPQDLDEELRELVRLARERLRRRLEGGIVPEQTGILRLDHPGAGARRQHHLLRLREELYRARGHEGGIAIVARVEQRHAAAGLARREVHCDAEASEELDHGHAHLGEEHLPQARDHDRGLHDFCAPGPCGGGGVTITSTSIGSLPSLTSPCSIPASATRASPWPSRSSLPPTEKRPLPSRTQ